jgi:hypothetical protein
VASYNKNAGAPNDPDGIVAVWNLHLLERPEFVFHAPVSSFARSLSYCTSTDVQVGRTISDFLALSSYFDLWWLILWSSLAMGHTSKTPSSP